MKPGIRYRSQLLFRKSYKPNRVIRIRAAVGCDGRRGHSLSSYKPNRVIRIRAAQRVVLVLRPARAGPQPSAI